MSITMTNGSVTYQQNEFFNLRKNKIFYSSKSISGCYGKWYFEGTHKPGGTGFHLFGFGYTNFQGVYFYPQGSKIPRVRFTKQFSPYDGDGDLIPMSFEVGDDHTVGLGIDYDNEMFTVYYNDNYYVHHFKKPEKCGRIFVIIRGASIEMSDDVSVNFGSSPFKYNITSFTPWQENIGKIYCFA